jgi:hypothetical protein
VITSKVEHWDDERGIGNSLIVTLAPGWQFGNDPAQHQHVEGFDTVREARMAVRRALRCACTECSLIKATRGMV